MIAAIPKEVVPGEHRVAVVPDTAAKLVAAGVEVVVESGAGAGAYVSDQALREAGAEVARDAARVWSQADVVLKVQPPTDAEASKLREGAALVSFLEPESHPDVIRALLRRKVTSFSLELVPRISRAQSMDALSSQASVAGYKAVLIAASRLGKFFPLLMTAAGTVAPARVLIMGAGVAGLQAIATARRLGALVEAYDVRPSVKEEVQSLGATFVELQLEAKEGEGGYAAEQSEDFLRRQRELIGERVGAADVVITTAAVPGRKAPVLITRDMVTAMRPGSVIVDLAAESGGNTQLTRVGEVVESGGVFIEGPRNLAGSVSQHASQLYARNVANLLLHLIKDGSLALDFEDEITNGSCVTHDGKLISPRAQAAVDQRQPAASGSRQSRGARPKAVARPKPATRPRKAAQG